LVVKEQRRSRRIAMAPDERDEFLRGERTCRLASVKGTGAPHLSALWFVWDGNALWVTSIVKSQRWTDIARDRRVSVLVDTGHDFGELRGVEISGRAESVGEVPRTGEPNDELVGPEQLFADKYSGGTFHHDGRHAWLRIVPEKIVSWDFRKMSAG
jgi:hypothetical protein